MDTITDILSTFFVTKRNDDTKRETERIVYDEYSIYDDFTEQTKKEKVTKVHKETQFSEELTEKVANEVADIKQENTQENDIQEQQEKTEVEVKQVNQEEKEAEEKRAEHQVVVQAADTSVSTEIVESKYSESILSSITDVSGDDDISRLKLKKYTLKPKEFYNKNIMIVGSEKTSNMQVLSDILHKLSMLTDVKDTFNNTIYIFTKNHNKKMYKKLLLDNPYLYFNDIQINKLDNENIKDTKYKKTIYIVDENTFDLNTVKDNTQFIIISNDIVSGIRDIYAQLGDRKMLLYKINKLKLNQKQFYKKVIKKLAKKVFSDFEDFYTSLNNEYVDAKYIVFKNSELRYN
jgi:hypothetical protein